MFLPSWWRVCEVERKGHATKLTIALHLRRICNVHHKERKEQGANGVRVQGEEKPKLQQRAKKLEEYTEYKQESSRKKTEIGEK